tara:strand:- start:109 stop:651 length:543 start_codon:yes stop_codon:yes gene_type:complete
MIILVISFTFQQKYFNKNNKEILKNSSDVDLKISEKNSYIEAFNYTAEDLQGNKYTIESKNANYENNNSEIIILTKVLATIDLVNSENIEIYAKKAIYNTLNQDTNFSNGVLINYSHHSIESENLDLSFNKKTAFIYKNIIYKNLNTTLRADKIEIDLITKDSKVFMYDKSKNIKIINKK